MTVYVCTYIRLWYHDADGSHNTCRRALSKKKMTKMIGTKLDAMAHDKKMTKMMAIH